MATPGDGPAPGGSRVRERSGPGAIAAARAFLRAQGPAGFIAGSLLDWAAAADRAPDRDATVIAVAPDAGGALEAVVVTADRRSAVVAPLPEAFGTVLDVLGRRRTAFDRITLPLALHDRWLAQAPELLAGARGHTVWLTRLGRLRVPRRPLPKARPAREADAEALQAIYHHVFWMRDDRLERWRERLRRGHVWVVELDGVPVAAARWTRAFAGQVEVGSLACLPEARRRGAATAALLAAITAAQRAGRTVYLRYGDPALAPLYHGLGFEHVGRHRFLTWDEAG